MNCPGQGSRAPREPAASAPPWAWGLCGAGQGFLTGCPGLVFRKPLLGKAEDFTIYIKNFIRFPKFNFFKYVELSYWGSRGGALAGPPRGCAGSPCMCVCM